jgi:hypothetical protein
MTKKAAFVDLPAADFPFRIRIVDDERGVVWEETVDGPGALAVPGFGPERADHRHVEVVYPDGSVVSTKEGD